MFEGCTGSPTLDRRGRQARLNTSQFPSWQMSTLIGTLHNSRRIQLVFEHMDAYSATCGWSPFACPWRPQRQSLVCRTVSTLIGPHASQGSPTITSVLLSLQEHCENIAHPTTFVQSRCVGSWEESAPFSSHSRASARVMNLLLRRTQTKHREMDRHCREDENPNGGLNHEPDEMPRGVWGNDTGHQIMWTVITHHRLQMLPQGQRVIRIAKDTSTCIGHKGHFQTTHCHRKAQNRMRNGWSETQQKLSGKKICIFWKKKSGRIPAWQVSNHTWHPFFRLVNLNGSWWPFHRSLTRRKMWRRREMLRCGRRNSRENWVLNALGIKRENPKVDIKGSGIEFSAHPFGTPELEIPNWLQAWNKLQSADAGTRVDAMEEIEAHEPDLGRWLDSAPVDRFDCRGSPHVRRSDKCFAKATQPVDPTSGD